MSNESFAYVEDTEVGASAGDSLFCQVAEGALELELVDTLVNRLAVGGTLGGVLLAVTAANTDTVDHVALLGLFFCDIATSALAHPHTKDRSAI